MKSELSPLPSITAVVTMAVLAGALGAFLGRLHGLQTGWVSGIVLAFLPFVASRLRLWLSRPDGLPRFVLREIGTAVVAAIAPVFETAGRPFAAVARILRGPVLLAKLIAFAASATVAAWIGRAAKELATPLGVANIAAVLIIAGVVARSQVASIAVFAGLPAMILVLLVAQYEAERTS
jgi:hypothetical protein